ncbi:glutamine cyclotransferase [Thalassospira marina]|uniref:Glutamine cyclotransferase n=1 Tax=Thalassospira marina TaxID=2048283 RepID=A0A2N3KNF1_9PROT|nr:glutamine cyclotransferase [Thalassospira marina]PKR52013.1 glutamine cyclotransferase [Thalassospira marina]
MKRMAAEITGEFGPLEGVTQVNGVTYDGEKIWFAAGSEIIAINPEDGSKTASLTAEADAGTAFDGTYFYQIADSQINKIDPENGKVVATIPAPGGGAASGMAWAEGSLWVGQYRDRKIHEIDPNNGDIRRTILSDRFVTGVTWLGGELWHGTWENEESSLRQIDASNGTVLAQIDMPEGVGVSGLESDGKDRFFCGGGNSGKVRIVHKNI